MQVHNLERRESTKFANRIQTQQNFSDNGFDASLFSMIQNNFNNIEVSEQTKQVGSEIQMTEQQLVNPKEEKEFPQQSTEKEFESVEESKVKSIAREEEHASKTNRTSPKTEKENVSVATHTEDSSKAKEEPLRVDAKNPKPFVAMTNHSDSNRISFTSTTPKVSNEVSGIQQIGRQDAVFTAADTVRSENQFSKPMENLIRHNDSPFKAVSIENQLPLFKEAPGLSTSQLRPTSNTTTQAENVLTNPEATMEKANEKIVSENKPANNVKSLESTSTSSTPKSSAQPVASQAQGYVSATTAGGSQKGTQPVTPGQNVTGAINHLGEVAKATASLRPGSTEGTNITQRISQIEQILSKTSGSILKLANGGGGKMTLRLDPPAMGKLQVEVEIMRGMCNARVLAEDPAAKATLMQSLPQLREALESQGLKLEGFSVDDHSQMSSSGRDAAQQREGSAQQRGQARFTSDPLATETKSDTRQVRPHHMLGVVDLHV